MCGSTASCLDGPEGRSTAGSSRLLRFLLHTVVPVLVHLFGRGYFGGPHQAETKEQSVGVIPDALGKLRVLLLPGRIAAHARAAAELIRCVAPRSTARHVRV